MQHGTGAELAIALETTLCSLLTATMHRACTTAASKGCTSAAPVVTGRENELYVAETQRDVVHESNVSLLHCITSAASRGD